MNKKCAFIAALCWAFLFVAPERLNALDTPPGQDETLLVEAGPYFLGGAMFLGPSEHLRYLAAARVSLDARDLRLGAGAVYTPIQGNIYELQLLAIAGPRLATLDDFGAGLHAQLRSRGLWRWPIWGLHAGLFLDAANELVGLTGSRLRPGADLGVGFFPGTVQIWLSLQAGYTLGGAGAGGLALGGSLGLQW